MEHFKPKGKEEVNMGRRGFFKRSGVMLASGLASAAVMKGARAEVTTPDSHPELQHMPETETETENAKSYEDLIKQILESIKESQDDIDKHKEEWMLLASCILENQEIDGEWTESQREMILDIAKELQHLYSQLDSSLYQIMLAIKAEESLDDIIDLGDEYEHTRKRIAVTHKKAKRMPYFFEYKDAVLEQESAAEKVNIIKET